MASYVMEIFEEEYEYAPENKVLKKYYEINKTESKLYEASKLIDTIFFKTYLFYTDTHFDLNNELDKIIEQNGSDENLVYFLNIFRDLLLYKNYTRLLSLKGKSNE